MQLKGTNWQDGGHDRWCHCSSLAAKVDAGWQAQAEQILGDPGSKKRQILTALMWLSSSTVTAKGPELEARLRGGLSFSRSMGMARSSPDLLSATCSDWENIVYLKTLLDQQG